MLNLPAASFTNQAQPEPNNVAADFEKASFDAIISIDTLYFVEDLEKTVAEILSLLKPNGRLGIFYTQWTKKDKLDILEPENTHFAQILNKEKIKYEYFEFTDNETKHWKKKIEVLEKLKPEFEKEGNLDLYDFRYEEASRVMNQKQKQDIVSRRYLYVAKI